MVTVTSAYSDTFVVSCGCHCKWASLYCLSSSYDRPWLPWPLTSRHHFSEHIGQLKLLLLLYAISGITFTSYVMFLAGNIINTVWSDDAVHIWLKGFSLIAWTLPLSGYGITQFSQPISVPCWYPCIDLDDQPWTSSLNVEFKSGFRFDIRDFLLEAITQGTYVHAQLRSLAGEYVNPGMVLLI